MESLKSQNIKLEKANAVLRYKKHQRMTTLFRFIEFSIFFIIISRISIQLPLNFKLSTEYFKGVSVTLFTPRFVFVLGNAIVIILFLISGQETSKSTTNVKIHLYDEYKQKYTMNEESAHCEQSKKQVEEAYCEQVKNQKKQSIVVEKRIPRSHSGNSLCLSHDEKKPKKKMIRSATVGCLKALKTESVKSTTTKMKISSYPEDGMSNDEFRKTVEDFIARQQRFLKDEEFSESEVVSS